MKNTSNPTTINLAAEIVSRVDLQKFTLKHVLKEEDLHKDNIISLYKSRLIHITCSIIMIISCILLIIAIMHEQNSTLKQWR